MKRNILFFVLLFICLFGFWNRVEAVDYKLEYSNDEEEALIDRICSLSSTYPCTASCNGTNIGQVNGNNSIASLNDACGDNIDVKITKINNFNDFRRVINTENEISVQLQEYCKSYTKNGLCKKFIETRDEVIDDDKTLSCPADVISWYKDETGNAVTHPRLMIEYDKKKEKVSIFPGDRDGSSQNYGNAFSFEGKNYHFYSVKTGEGGYKEFLDGLASEFKKNGNRSSCNRIFIFCPLNEGCFKEWYAELDSSKAKKCDEIDSRYAPITQSVGGSSSGSVDIDFSTEENKKRAEEMLGKKKVTIDTCADLFNGTGENGTMLLDILKVLVGIVKVGVPALLLIMGSIDFAKAIFSQDDGGIKKAQGRFVKRLIIALIIFLIPTVLKSFFNIAHGIWPEIVKSSDDIFCGIL